MRWASTLSRRHRTAEALAEAAEAIRRRLAGVEPDLVLAFVSEHHAAACHLLAPLVAERLPRALLVGCTAGGVIGDAHEVEDGPAVSLTAAALPGVELSGFHVDATSLPAPEADPSAWEALVGSSRGRRPKILLLADPFTIGAEALVAGLDRAYPGAPKFGGLASGGSRPGENRLLIGGEVHRTGAVGIAFSGSLAVDTVVAQGCRPIGTPMLVTRCRGGLIQELDGRPPLQILAELHAGLEERDRELMRRSLFLGIDMRGERIEFDPGELLVRNLVGLERGALAVGAELRPMQAVQFVVRDARAAEQDLARLLGRQPGGPGRRPAGALLFSCIGRGAALFGRIDHDTGLLEEKLGPVPLGGFFCNGEIGPVGGTTFVHGYTSAFVLFRDAAPPRRS